MKPIAKERETVWHLTHTDLRVDFRIQKAMEATRVSGKTVIGISFSSHAGYQTKDAHNNDLVGFVVPFGKRKKSTDVDRSVTSNTISLEIAARRSNWGQKLFMIPFAIVKLLIRTKQGRPAAVWVHDFPLLIPGLVLSCFLGPKLIYDAHELNGHAAGHTGLWSSLIVLGQKLAWKRIAGFVTVSESIRQWFLTTYGPKKSIVVTNSPMSEPASGLATRQPSIREAFQIPQESVIFSYVGALEAGRNIETLLRIFAKPERASLLVFVGDGSLKGEVLDLCESVSAIRHHPPVQNWKIAELLSDVDYGFVLIEPVSLSDRFSLPNKLFEYLDSGVIPIASKLPDIERAIEESKSGHVVETHEDSMERLIRKLERAGRPSHRSILPEKYRWENQKLKLADFVSEIVS